MHESAKGIYRKEVKKAINKFKCGETAGVHGITPEMEEAESPLPWPSSWMTLPDETRHQRQ